MKVGIRFSSGKQLLLQCDLKNDYLCHGLEVGKALMEVILAVLRSHSKNHPGTWVTRLTLLLSLKGFTFKDFVHNPVFQIHEINISADIHQVCLLRGHRL